MSQELGQEISRIPFKGDIHFYGMKRSGNHAIIHWILGHFNEYLFFNNCVVGSELSYRDLEGFHCSPTIENPMVLLSFEDDLVNGKSNLDNLGNLGGKKVIIIRDPLNCYASRIKKSEELGWMNIGHYIETSIWKDIAKEYLGITNKFGARIKINYNQWFSDISYRRALSYHFGIFSDKNIDYVSVLGNGSSFDARNFDGQASRMNVLERWKEVKDIHIYKYFFGQILKDKELVELAKVIYPSFPDKI